MRRGRRHRVLEPEHVDLDGATLAQGHHRAPRWQQRDPRGRPVRLEGTTCGMQRGTKVACGSAWFQFRPQVLEQLFPMELLPGCEAQQLDQIARLATSPCSVGNGPPVTIDLERSEHSYS